MPPGDKKKEKKKPKPRIKRRLLLDVLKLGARVDLAKPSKPDPGSVTANIHFFSGSSVTVTVTVPVDANRSNYAVYGGQTDGSGATNWALVAASAGQPSGNQLGSSIGYTQSRDFMVVLNYDLSGAQRAVSVTVPAASVVSGSNLTNLAMS